MDDYSIYVNTGTDEQMSLTTSSNLAIDNNVLNEDILANDQEDVDAYPNIYYQEPTQDDELVANGILPDMSLLSIENAIKTMGDERYTHGLRMAIGLAALKHMLCLAEKNCTFPTPAELGMETTTYTRKCLSWMTIHADQPCCGSILLPLRTEKLLSEYPPTDPKTFMISPYKPNRFQ